MWGVWGRGCVKRKRRAGKNSQANTHTIDCRLQCTTPCAFAPAKILSYLSTLLRPFQGQPRQCVSIAVSLARQVAQDGFGSPSPVQFDLAATRCPFSVCNLRWLKLTSRASHPYHGGSRGRSSCGTGPSPTSICTEVGTSSTRKYAPVIVDKTPYKSTFIHCVCMWQGFKQSLP